MQLTNTCRYFNSLFFSLFFGFIYIIIKQNYIKTKLISRRVAFNTHTEYLLHATPSTDLDPPLNVSQKITAQDHYDVILNLISMATDKFGKKMTSYVSKGSNKYSFIFCKHMCCLPSCFKGF